MDRPGEDKKKPFLQRGTFWMTVVGVAWCLFQIFLALRGAMHPIIQRPIHVTFAVIMTFLCFPGTREALGDTAGRLYKGANAVFVLLTLVIGVYLVADFPRLSIRVPYSDPITTVDIVFTFALVVLTLEATRRIVGNSLTIVTLVFIAYGFLGPYLPPILGHRGVTIRQFVDTMFLSLDGIFGMPTGVSIDNIFYFILFGAFLEVTGGGRLFIDLAVRLSGVKRGAPARVTVIGSALLGTMSGSAVANVTTVGVFTIPMMKKVGYRPVVAGGIEAAASTGGQIMPPIMGAGAFVMAEMLGIRYGNVAVAAIIPALLYYISILFIVTFFAYKESIGDIDPSSVQGSSRELFRRIHLIVPLLVLIYYIAMQSSLMTAAFRATVAAVLVSLVRAETRLSLQTLIAAFAKTAKSAAIVAIPCATAGIIVGIVVLTGLALKFSDIIQLVSGGTVLGALVVSMIGCIIMGMGMPTTSAYIMGAVLFAPSLTSMGIPPLAAHFFIFFFAVTSMVTPPVALAAYAAAAIANADMGKTGWKAFQISLAAFLVPYAFVYDQALLGQGPLPQILFVCVSASFGVMALSVAVTGFFTKLTSPLGRVIMFVCAVLMIAPEKMSSIAGFAILVAVFAWQWRSRGRPVSLLRAG